MDSASQNEQENVPNFQETQSEKTLDVVNTNLQNSDATGLPTLLLLGNAGAGKSTLLAQLGGKFDSGAKFRRGFTKDVSEELVKVDGRDMRLIDVPGLFEPDNKETQFNVEKLNEALGHKYYNYRIYFVLKAGNRGPDEPEMVMMSKISECVRKADGSQMSFGVIVNQIPSSEIETMYNHLAEDNFRSMFDALEIPGFTFNIKIDSVLMLPFDEPGLVHHRFRDKLTEEIHKYPASAIKLEKKISFCNNDLKLYQTAHLGRVTMVCSESLALVNFMNGCAGVVRGFNRYFDSFTNIFGPISESLPPSYRGRESTT